MRILHWIFFDWKNPPGIFSGFGTSERSNRIFPDICPAGRNHWSCCVVFWKLQRVFFPALARLLLYMSAEIKKIPGCLKKLRCIFRFQLFWLNGICRKNLSLNIILCGVQSYCFNDHLEERNSINCFRRVLHHIETMSPEPSVRRGSRKKPVRLAEMTLDIKLWQKSNDLPFPAASLNNGVLKSVSTTRQVSDNTALDTIPANRDFASTGELAPGRTISLNCHSAFVIIYHLIMKIQGRRSAPGQCLPIPENSAQRAVSGL